MIYLIAYALFCIAFARLNWYWIEVKDYKIKHFWNGLIHLAAAAAGWYFFSWQIGVSILFVARLVFDTALNLFRGKAIDYISPSPKSIVDKIEKKVFNNDGIMPKLTYFAIIVLLNIFK